MSENVEKPEVGKEVSKDDELDELLDDALNDFGKPPPTSDVKKEESKDTDTQDLTPGLPDAGWSDEFIKQAAAEFEQNVQAILSQEGVNTEGYDSAAASAGFQKMAEAAAWAMSGDNLEGNFTETIAQTLKNLSEGAENLQSALSEEEVARMLGGLGLGGGEGGDGSGELLPFMQQMMQTLLSKDILYPALKDILDKYPAWLEQHAPQLPELEASRYRRQHELMQQVCGELEQESFTDSPELKRQRFDRILGLMHQMQDCGQPPKELVGDLGELNALMRLDDGSAGPRVAGTDPAQCAVM